MLTKILESFTQELDKNENKERINKIIGDILYNYKPIFYAFSLILILIVFLNIYQIHKLQTYFNQIPKN